MLGKHKGHDLVIPLMGLKRKEQLRIIAGYRQQGIREHNMRVIEEGGSNFMREREREHRTVSQNLLCVPVVKVFFRCHTDLDTS